MAKDEVRIEAFLLKRLCSSSSNFGSPHMIRKVFNQSKISKIRLSRRRITDCADDVCVRVIDICKGYDLMSLVAREMLSKVNELRWKALVNEKEAHGSGSCDKREEVSTFPDTS